MRFSYHCNHCGAELHRLTERLCAHCGVPLQYFEVRERKQESHSQTRTGFSIASLRAQKAKWTQMRRAGQLPSEADIPGLGPWMGGDEDRERSAYQEDGLFVYLDDFEASDSVEAGGEGRARGFLLPREEDEGGGGRALLWKADPEEVGRLSLDAGLETVMGGEVVEELPTLDEFFEEGMPVSDPFVALPHVVLLTADPYRAPSVPKSLRVTSRAEFLRWLSDRSTKISGRRFPIPADDARVLAMLRYTGSVLNALTLPKPFRGDEVATPLLLLPPVERGPLPRKAHSHPREFPYRIFSNLRRFDANQRESLFLLEEAKGGRGRIVYSPSHVTFNGIAPHRRPLILDGQKIVDDRVRFTYSDGEVCGLQASLYNEEPILLVLSLFRARPGKFYFRVMEHFLSKLPRSQPPNSKENPTERDWLETESEFAFVRAEFALSLQAHETIFFAYGPDGYLYCAIRSSRGPTALYRTSLQDRAAGSWDYPLFFMEKILETRRSADFTDERGRTSQQIVDIEMGAFRFARRDVLTFYSAKRHQLPTRKALDTTPRLSAMELSQAAIDPGYALLPRWQREGYSLLSYGFAKQATRQFEEYPLSSSGREQVEDIELLESPHALKLYPRATSRSARNFLVNGRFYFYKAVKNAPTQTLFAMFPAFNLTTERIAGQQGRSRTAIAEASTRLHCRVGVVPEEVTRLELFHLEDNFPSPLPQVGEASRPVTSFLQSFRNASTGRQDWQTVPVRIEYSVDGLDFRVLRSAIRSSDPVLDGTWRGRFVRIEGDESTKGKVVFDGFQVRALLLRLSVDQRFAPKVRSGALSNPRDAAFSQCFRVHIEAPGNVNAGAFLPRLDAQIGRQMLKAFQDPSEVVKIEEAFVQRHVERSQALDLSVRVQGAPERLSQFMVEVRSRLENRVIGAFPASDMRKPLEAGRNMRLREIGFHDLEIALVVKEELRNPPIYEGKVHTLRVQVVSSLIELRKDSTEVKYQPGQLVLVHNLKELASQNAKYLIGRDATDPRSKPLICEGEHVYSPHYGYYELDPKARSVEPSDTRKRSSHTQTVEIPLRKIFDLKQFPQEAFFLVSVGGIGLSYKTTSGEMAGPVVELINGNETDPISGDAKPLPAVYMHTSREGLTSDRPGFPELQPMPSARIERWFDDNRKQFRRFVLGEAFVGLYRLRLEDLRDQDPQNNVETGAKIRIRYRHKDSVLPNQRAKIAYLKFQALSDRLVNSTILKQRTALCGEAGSAIPDPKRVTEIQLAQLADTTFASMIRDELVNQSGCYADRLKYMSHDGYSFPFVARWNNAFEFIERYVATNKAVIPEGDASVRRAHVANGAYVRKAATYFQGMRAMIWDLGTTLASNSRFGRTSIAKVNQALIGTHKERGDLTLFGEGYAYLTALKPGQTPDAPSTWTSPTPELLGIWTHGSGRNAFQVYDPQLGYLFLEIVKEEPAFADTHALYISGVRPSKSGGVADVTIQSVLRTTKKLGAAFTMTLRKASAMTQGNYRGRVDAYGAKDILFADSWRSSDTTIRPQDFQCHLWFFPGIDQGKGAQTKPWKTNLAVHWRLLPWETLERLRAFELGHYDKQGRWKEQAIPENSYLGKENGKVRSPFAMRALAGQKQSRAKFLSDHKDNALMRRAIGGTPVNEASIDSDRLGPYGWRSKGSDYIGGAEREGEFFRTFELNNAVSIAYMNKFWHETVGLPASAKGGVVRAMALQKKNPDYELIISLRMSETLGAHSYRGKRLQGAGSYAGGRFFWKNLRFAPIVFFGNGTRLAGPSAGLSLAYLAYQDHLIDMLCAAASDAMLSGKADQVSPVSIKLDFVRTPTSFGDAEPPLVALYKSGIGKAGSPESLRVLREAYLQEGRYAVPSADIPPIFLKRQIESLDHTDPLARNSEKGRRIREAIKAEILMRFLYRLWYALQQRAQAHNHPHAVRLLVGLPFQEVYTGGFRPSMWQQPWDFQAEKALSGARYFHIEQWLQLRHEIHRLFTGKSSTLKRAGWAGSFLHTLFPGIYNTDFTDTVSGNRYKFEPNMPLDDFIAMKQADTTYFRRQGDRQTELRIVPYVNGNVTGLDATEDNVHAGLKKKQAALPRQMWLQRLHNYLSQGADGVMSMNYQSSRELFFATEGRLAAGCRDAKENRYGVSGRPVAFYNNREIIEAWHQFEQPLTDWLTPLVFPVKET